MKIKTDICGVFYKDGEKWRGPLGGDVFTTDEILQEYDSLEDYLKILSKEVKKKTRLFRQVWKSVDEE